MQSFQLDFYLKAPVILTNTLHLDALLAYAVYKQTGCLEQAHEKLPLMRTDKIWHGSALRLTQPCRIIKQTYVQKLNTSSDMNPDKFLPQHTGGKYRYIDQKRGQYKANLDNYNAYECRDLEKQGRAVFFGHGDVEAVRDLIEHHIFGLGKKHGSFGSFTHFTITSTDQDYSWFHPEMGLMRAMPPKYIKDELNYSTALASYYPPYYGDDAVLCGVPSDLFMPVSEDKTVEIF